MKTEDPKLCVARGRAYDLLGTGLLEGLRPDRVDHFRAVPALAPHIDDTPDPDLWAAAHHTALSLEVPPYESAFLSSTGQLDDGAHIQAALSRGGFGGTRADVPADHAGISLHYLAWLSGAEADALRDGQERALQEVRGLSADFIDSHLGRWLPALAVALKTSPGVHPFFAEVALLAAELLVEHRALLGATPEPWSLPALPDPLENKDTRLADLARYLVTPSQAGGLLSRSALGEVGRAASVPKGFGSRALMLTNLMKSAAEFDSLNGVIAGLQAQARTWAEAHDALHACHWADRSRETIALLDRMAEAAQLRE